MVRTQTGVKSAAMRDGPRDDDGSPGEIAKLVRLMVLFAAVGIAFVPRLAKAKTKKLDLPYVTIDHPQFVLASQATFLSPRDMLIGVTDGKTAKAYPAAILAQHGVVQDQMADGPIAITW
jgi:hypothetical protein